VTGRAEREEPVEAEGRLGLAHGRIPFLQADSQALFT
jgi:hypothetical protein